MAVSICQTEGRPVVCKKETVASLAVPPVEENTKGVNVPNSTSVTLWLSLEEDFVLKVIAVANEDIVIVANSAQEIQRYCQALYSSQALLSPSAFGTGTKTYIFAEMFEFLAHYYNNNVYLVTVMNWRAKHFSSRTPPD